jgi:hypothetical protein
VFPFILSIACSYHLDFLWKSNKIFIFNVGSRQSSFPNSTISSNPSSSNYISAESNASSSIYETALSSTSSYPTPPPNLPYSSNESSLVDFPSTPNLSSSSNLPPSPNLSAKSTTSSVSSLKLPPALLGTPLTPLTEPLPKYFNKSVSRLPEFLESRTSFQEVDDTVSLPNSELNITKGTPRAGSAMSGDTPSMNPSLRDRESFFIPGNQFFTRYSHEVTFQPSASFLA